MSKTNIIHYMVLILFCALFVVHAVSFSFTQDDAFISYRYAKNFLNGEGLVFNPGERVEGYTNLFFIILMIFLGRLGVDIIIASKILGVVSGTILIIVSYFWSRKIPIVKDNPFLSLAVPFLLTANSVLAYWAISGLETLFFATLVLGGLYLAVSGRLLFIPILAIATLTRPEGAMVFIVILIYYILAKDIAVKDAIKYLAIFALLVIPQIVYRLSFYHDILPNPFYAKTGWSVDYLTSGLEYVWLFLSRYGLYGAILVVPLLAVRYLTSPMRLLLAVTVIYTLYILLIGGDVLHCHRFFMPIIAFYYLLLVASLIYIAANSYWLRNIGKNQLLIPVVLIIGVINYVAPGENIDGFLAAEKGLVNKMTHLAFVLRSDAHENSLIACSTIGAFSYYGDARVVDMLGLTDRTIAHNPESFDKIKSTWKERNYNIPYVLRLNPDFIIFSTSLKPSAPAEKALFLSSKFRQGYYPVFGIGGGIKVIYKKRPDFAGKDEYFNDPAFIDYFVDAINYQFKDNYEQAYASAYQSIMTGPPDFYLPLSIMGEIEIEFGDPAIGIDILREALAKSNGYATLSADCLAKYYENIGDTAAAREIYRSLIPINRLN